MFWMLVEEVKHYAKGLTENQARLYALAIISRKYQKDWKREKH